MGGVCASCGTTNPERARFCMRCGAPLEANCPSCGAENPPGARFCIDCGARLVPESAPQATPASAPPPEERRTATVLFADLSGYTAVAERMDPEALKSLVDRALRRLGEEVVRFGGSVDKFIGDNVMAVFGAPVAHEDDPERAVRAGLAMQAAMPEINARIAADADVEFALRVGVNSGEVLAGQVGDRYTVIGDPVNVAARLQAAARPGSVTVGEATHRLTQGAIEYSELAPLTLKGKSEPVAAWEAVRVASRPRATRAETPLIGRDDESELLVSLYERVVREGRPHLVTVVGQAGVGKSRLLREVAARLSEHDQAPLVRVGRCPAYGSGLAFWALGEIVREQFEIVDTDAADVAWRKLREGVASLLVEADPEPGTAEHIAGTIARAFGVEPPAEFGAADEDPQANRARLFSAVRALTEGAAQMHPLVIAIEDIHWADEGMLDLIEHLARWTQGPALFICMARDELLDRRPSWGGGRRNTTTLALEPLAREDARRLVASLIEGGGNGAGGLDPATVAQVAERSGGNPLFAEEMVNRILEGGGAGAPLPETVHAVLAARLDALPDPERRLLQHAAVVGQRFWPGAVAAAVGDPDELERAIGGLVDKDLIVPSEGSRLAGESEYAFKHVLIRDVAYSTLPKAVRARKHAEVGEFIERRAADRSEGVVGMVAEHLARAASVGTDARLAEAELDGIHDRAHRALEAAGDAAAGLYSNNEAFGHYETALSLDGEHCAHPDVRARIAEKLGDVALRLGRIDRAVELWEECLDYHRGQEDLARVGDLHRKIGAGLWHKGDREGSVAHYQRGINMLKDGPPSIELVRLYEEAATLYMHTGQNMVAIYTSEKALRLAERLGESAAASRAHGIFGRVFGRIGDLAQARSNLERSVELARESEPAEAVRALLALGYHLETSEADYDAAAAAYNEALEIAERMGDVPSQVELHGSLAMLALHRSQWEAVEAGAERSAELIEREGLTGKLCFPNLLRGALAWRDGDLDAATRSLRRAAMLADEAGRSEVAFAALRWLVTVLGDRSDYADADQALAMALDICERAGLVAQSVEATAARAINFALWGRREQAEALADEARSVAQRVPYPVGEVSALEARGAVARDPEALERARAEWARLGRPLDAERVERLTAALSA